MISINYKIIADPMILVLAEESGHRFQQWDTCTPNADAPAAPPPLTEDSLAVRYEVWGKLQWDRGGGGVHTPLVQL